MINRNFSPDDIAVSANTDGSMKVEFKHKDGVDYWIIPANSRHLFLSMLQKAVDMADIADPANKL